MTTQTSGSRQSLLPPIQLLFALLLPLMPVGCGQAPAKPAAKITSPLPYTFTNFNEHLPGIPRFVFNVSNQVTFTYMKAWYNSQYVLDLDNARYSARVMLDSNQQPESVIQTVPAKEGGFLMLTDLNIDGMPDQRIPMGRRRDMELFLKGSWLPGRGPSTNREILKDGTWTPVRFIDGQWQEQTPTPAKEP